MIRRLCQNLLILIYIFTFSPAISATECEELTYESNDYILCDVTLSDDLRLWHSDKNGTLYGSFGQIDSALQATNQKLDFAMNAGMYHQDRSPVGLYVEQGKQISPLADGGTFGNFGLKPNGVFCFDKTAFSVIETNTFRRAKTACDYATQSGPMLVIDGKLHHRFLPKSTSRHIRNGVGVSADGTRATFAISENRVTFHEFGSLFRNHLKTPNALYFDGSISRLHTPDLNRSDSGFPLGVIIGTVTPR